MSLIDIILKINGARRYEVWSASITKDAATGSKIKTYSHLTDVYAVIQQTGTTKNINGLSLQPTQNQGDVNNADLVMYSKVRRNLKERVLYHNLYYDIRGIEDFDNGILKYYKAHLVKVDNQ